MSGNAYTPSETAALRAQHLRENLLPAVARMFADAPDLMSACLMLAQYWNDEADDAVHYVLVFSVLPEPDLRAYARYMDLDEPDDVNLPGAFDHFDLSCEEREWVEWDHNGAAIPLYAAFCKEGCEQQMPILDAHTTYALFRRGDEGVEVEVVGEMLRPWLDGVRPSWDAL